MGNLVLQSLEFIFVKLILFVNWATNWVRDCAVKHRKVAVIFIFLSLVAYGYGNWEAPRGGILENPITKKEDIYNQSHQYVMGKTQFTDAFKVPIKCPNGITRKALRKLVDWTERFQGEFGDGVVSLSLGFPTISVGEDGTVFTKPYITREDLDYLDSISEEEWLNFVDKWKKDLKGDSARGIEPDPAFGFIVELDFSALHIIVNLERGYNDSDILWRVCELVEERQIPWWERIYKTEIVPKDPDILIAGWPVGRGLLYQVLNVDMVRGITVGISVSFLLFRLVLGSWNQAIISTLMVLISMFYMRGTIGILHVLGLDIKMLGMPIRETVYILSALSVCIVQGVSFSLHKFNAFNEEGSWISARKVDSLIFNTAVISIFGFITLYTFEVRSIRELGLIAAFGVFYLLILATVVIPLFGALTGDWLSRLIRKFIGAWLYRKLTCFLQGASDTLLYRKIAFCFQKVSQWYAQGIRWISNKFSYLALIKARYHLIFVVLLCAFALHLLYKGKLEVGTNPGEYLTGTISHETIEFLNQEGRSGFAPVSIYVEAESEDIHDPEFIRSVSDFQKELYSKGARVVFSVVNLAKCFSYKLYCVTVPSTKADAERVFSYLRNGTSPEVRYQLWTKEFIRILAFVKMDNSKDIGAFNEAVVELGKKYKAFKVTDFKLRALPFGDGALYPREDYYIVLSKPKNVGWSEIIVIVLCIGIIFQKARVLRLKRLHPVLGGAIMGVPFIFASAATFIIMIWLDVPLDVATAIITALAINASIDFSIYYVIAYMEALAKADKDNAVVLAMRDKGEIIINDIILNSACFSPLMLSSFTPISRLGWMMVAMIFACGIGSLIIMPSLLRVAVDFRFRKWIESTVV